MQKYKYSAKALELIKRFEGLSLRAYRCAAGKWTVGYGHSGTDVKPCQVITPAEAERLLSDDLNRLLRRFDPLLPEGLSQNQVDALVSFAFNVGVGAFRGSTLLKKVKKDAADPTIRAEFLRWNKCKGRVLRGLTLRRQAEARLYSEARPVASSPTDTTAATQSPMAK